VAHACPARSAQRAGAQATVKASSTQQELDAAKKIFSQNDMARFLPLKLGTETALNTLVSVDEGGEVSGALVYSLDPGARTAQIEFYAVDPGRRAEGIGGGLLREFMREMKEKGASRILVNPTCELQESFYAHFGFQKLPPTGHEFFGMAKDL
jgi:predicted N-acetyltransferase YhbS